MAASPGSITKPRRAARNVAKSLPLFPSAKRAALQSLIVRRFEEGRWVRVPEPLSGDALPDRESVRARFGGGRYEIIGRDAHQIVARTRFVVHGPPRPIEGGAPSMDRSQTSPARPFATSAGEREALVFGLLDEGLDVVDITRSTGIEAKIVRAIFEEWCTPLGDASAIAARRADLARSRRRVLEEEADAAPILSRSVKDRRG